MANCRTYEIKIGHDISMKTGAINCAKMEVMRTSEVQRYFIKAIHHLFRCQRYRL